MVLGGLRRCEVLGLRLEDLRAGERRVFIAEGKGGHQRVVPMAERFFAVVGDYLHDERPRPCASNRVFVALKGRRRGEPRKVRVAGDPARGRILLVDVKETNGHVGNGRVEAVGAGGGG